jgi:CMP-N-acetylneuraminic acid synthetase
MWVKSGKYITPVMPFNEAGTPWHSMQYTSLPEVYVQNASLEIAWTSVPINKHSIAGDVIIPFFTTETEGQDVNYEYDLLYIDNLISSGMATLPAIKKETWRT